MVGRTLYPQQHTGVGWISSLEQLPLSSEQPRRREEGLSRDVQMKAGLGEHPPGALETILRNVLG